MRLFLAFLAASALAGCTTTGGTIDPRVALLASAASAVGGAIQADYAARNAYLQSPARIALLTEVRGF